jgi:hypothetical protein
MICKHSKEEAHSLLAIVDPLVSTAMDEARAYKDTSVSGATLGITADTIILTDTDLLPVRQLVGKSFNAIVDGVAYPSTSNGFRSAGVKGAFEVTLSNGLCIKATANHLILTDKGYTQVDQLTPSHEVTLSDNCPLVDGHSTNSATAKKSIQITQQWLRNLFDHNGKVEYTMHDGVKVTIQNTEAMLQKCQQFLLVFGITSSNTNGKVAIDDAAIRRFNRFVGFSDSTMSDMLRNASLDKTHTSVNYSSSVISIDLIGDAEVFDCTVPAVSCFSANGVIVHDDPGL